MDRHKITPHRFIGVKVNESDFQLLKATAARERLSTSQFLREAIRRYADQLLKETSQEKANQEVDLRRYP